LVLPCLFIAFFDCFVKFYVYAILYYLCIIVFPLLTPGTPLQVLLKSRIQWVYGGLCHVWVQAFGCVEYGVLYLRRAARSEAVALI